MFYKQIKIQLLKHATVDSIKTSVVQTIGFTTFPHAMLLKPLFVASFVRTCCKTNRFNQFVRLQRRRGRRKPRRRRRKSLLNHLELSVLAWDEPFLGIRLPIL